MPEGIGSGFTPVATPADAAALLIQNNGSHGDLPPGSSPCTLPQQTVHPLLMAAGPERAGRIGEWLGLQRQWTWGDTSLVAHPRR